MLCDNEMATKHHTLFSIAEIHLLSDLMNSKCVQCVCASNESRFVYCFSNWSVLSVRQTGKFKYDNCVKVFCL